MKKTKAFQASDGQLFLDGGKLVTHELKQTILKVLPAPDASNGSSVNEWNGLAEKISAALVAKHEVLFDALKLLRKPATRKKATTTAATPATDKKK